jgi:hypothetical protein
MLNVQMSDVPADVDGLEVALPRTMVNHRLRRYTFQTIIVTLNMVILQHHWHYDRRNTIHDVKRKR